MYVIEYPKVQNVQDDIELVGNAEMDIDDTVNQLNNLKKNLDGILFLLLL